MGITDRIAGRAKRLAGRATGNRRLERRGKRQLRQARRQAKRRKRVAKLAAAGGALALARRHRPKRIRGGHGKDETPPTRFVRRTVTTVDVYVDAEQGTGKP